MSGWVRECDRVAEVPGDFRQVAAEIALIEARLSVLKDLQKCDFRKAVPGDLPGLVNIKGVYVCSRCKQWTANLRLYKHSTCDVKYGEVPRG